MRVRSFLMAVFWASGMLITVAPATWAASITYQGVTFSTATVDANTFSLSMTGVQGATGNWAGIDSITAFALKDIGKYSDTTLTLANWTVTNSELSTSTASGCGGSGGGPHAYCFNYTTGTLPFSGQNTLNLFIDYTGTAPNLNSPHLKVLFAGADVPNGHGDLLSKNLTSVPVPS